MLTQVNLVDPMGNALSLPLQDNTNGYTVKNIEGLDPVKATITSSPFAQLDGSQSQGARRENRNIIMTIGLEPYSGGATVKALRSALYGWLMPKSFVTLQFFEDGAVTPGYTITGQVESFETPLFSKDPEVAVSLICFEPSFEEFTPHALGPFNTVTDTLGAYTTIVNPGTIEVGYLLTLSVNRPATTGFTIYNYRPGVTATQLDVVASLVNLDVVALSTRARDKSVLKNSTSILYAVPAASKWVPLYPGTNYIRVVCPGAAIPYTIGYTAKYGGL